MNNHLPAPTITKTVFFLEDPELDRIVTQVADADLDDLELEATLISLMIQPAPVDSA